MVVLRQRSCLVASRREDDEMALRWSSSSTALSRRAISSEFLGILATRGTPAELFMRRVSSPLFVTCCSKSTLLNTTIPVLRKQYSQHFLLEPLCEERNNIMVLRGMSANFWERHIGHYYQHEGIRIHYKNRDDLTVKAYFLS